MDLTDKEQKEIRKELEEVIRAEGVYREEDIPGLVQDGMDSKIVDLEDTINISKYIR